MGAMVTTDSTAPFIPTVVFHLCGCCLDHGDRPLTRETVTCVECGALCSCEGCVADAEGMA